jgi:hypothetical protein
MTAGLGAAAGSAADRWKLARAKTAKEGRRRMEIAMGGSIVGNEPAKRWVVADFY